MASNNLEPLEQTFLGKEAQFKGALSFKGTLCIDGKFEGEIHTGGTLIVSETGDIEADIQAGTVVCEGQVKGNIVASERVELRPKSKIIGNQFFIKMLLIIKISKYTLHIVAKKPLSKKNPC